MNQPDIISKFKQGDHSVFPEIVAQWQDMVYNTALGIVQSEEDAEDITQDVFVKVYEQAGSFREESTLSTWIYRITVNKSLDHEKRKKREKNGGFLKRMFTVQEEEEPVNFNHPGIAIENKESAALLLSAVKKLPEKQRIAFTLHKMEGLSTEEIAAVMNHSVLSVEALQQRAKKKLKTILKDYYMQHLQTH